VASHQLALANGSRYIFFAHGTTASIYYYNTLFIDIKTFVVYVFPFVSTNEVQVINHEISRETFS